MPEPDSGRTNRFYTAEFFTACSRSLSPGGVLALRLRGAENLWTPLATRRLAAIHRALRGAFDDVMVLPGTSHVLVASRGPLVRDPDEIATRLRRRDLRARLVTPAYATYLLSNDRFREMDQALSTAVTPANTDARPVCYPYTLLLWLSRFAPSLGRAEIPDLRPARLLTDPRGWLALAVVAGAAAVVRRRGLARRAALVGAVACAGMVIETVLLLDYQTRSGALYRDLGALLTAFMAGLAAGSAWLDRRTRRAGAGKAGPWLVIALAALASAIAALLETGHVLGLVPVAILLAATGFVVAALFAWAAAVAHPDPRVPIAPLYAADLAGGCLGSLGAALALVPLAGLPGAVELLAPLLLAAAILA